MEQDKPLDLDFEEMERWFRTMDTTYSRSRIHLISELRGLREELREYEKVKAVGVAAKNFVQASRTLSTCTIHEADEQTLIDATVNEDARWTSLCMACDALSRREVG
jgi:hypothetical protein